MRTSQALRAPREVSGATKPFRRLWIRSAGWDFFWIYSGVWLSALVALLVSMKPTIWLAVLLLSGARLVGLAHSWSTTYTILASPLLKTERRLHPWRYLGIPAGLFLGSLVLGEIVAHKQRFPFDGRLSFQLSFFVAYILLFQVGHFWHFGRQQFGVLSMYRMRTGRHSEEERKLDSAYAMALMYVIQPVVYLATLSTTAFSEIILTVIPVSAELLGKLASDALVVAFTLWVTVAGRELRQKDRSWPRLGYYLVMAVNPFLLYFGPQGTGLYFSICYLWGHWLTAIGLTGHLNLRYGEKHREKWSFLKYTAAIAGISAVVWAVTAAQVKYHLFSENDYHYKALLAALQPSELWIAGLFMGYFLGEQLVHYYCDRCLFRFKDPGIRRLVAPLL